MTVKNDTQYNRLLFKLWRVKTGKEICTYQGFNEAVYAVAFSLDGKKIAAAGADKKSYFIKTEFRSQEPEYRIEFCASGG
ncbi:MAG: hypothetical protein KAF91_07725 [Nostoc sp. TH1S01]|nr:hypothetical protein [Nostoc sp. TH1S01]